MATAERCLPCMPRLPTQRTCRCRFGLQSLQHLAEHLRSSQAGEQLRAMGTTLTSSISTLQVRGGRACRVHSSVVQPGGTWHLAPAGTCAEEALRRCLQLGGFTDFEELVSDARDECHGAVEAYLALQVKATCC